MSESTPNKSSKGETKDSSEQVSESRKRKMEKDNGEAGEPKIKSLPLEEWIEAWKQNHTAFHEGVPNYMLVKHLDKLVNDRSAIKVFFPLCGKAVDMKLLYDAGHTVVGVEVAEQALVEFFTENKMDYTVEKIDKIKGSVYKSTDGRIRLYCADLYAFSSDVESGMQAVFDRGSLVAINSDDRKKYADLLVSLLSDDCRYFLLTFIYDEMKFAGPPHSITGDVIRQLFGEKCDVSEVETVEGEQVQKDHFKLEELKESLHLITPKQKEVSMDTNVKKKATNPYHGSTDYKEIKASEWVTCWQENKTYFHKNEPNEMLVKHLDKLVNGRSTITVFFPFCGKSVDMKLLYDAGHTVVGIDVAEKALKEFFTENKIDYTVEKLNTINGSLYRSSDGRIRLYCADLYDFSGDIEGRMQGMWDRGGITAVNMADRKRYADLLTTLMSDDCQFLLWASDYDQEKYAGPPHAISSDLVNKLYGEKCNITKVESENALQPKQRDVWGLDWLQAELYVITLKQSQ